MSTAKSSYDNCLWSTDGHTEGQYQMINNHMNDMDYYLFGDNNIPTSELVKRVLSKTFLDINFVSTVQTQFNLIHSNNCAETSLIDVNMNDPAILSDIRIASISFDEDDDDYESAQHGYTDSSDNDGSFIDDTMMDLMDGVVYNNHSGFLWENLDLNDNH